MGREDEVADRVKDGAVVSVPHNRFPGISRIDSSLPSPPRTGCTKME